jgi:hypothetical protein
LGFSAAFTKYSTSRWIPWLGYALCVAGCLICLIAFYPGYMSPDSRDQWNQGRNWIFWDYHPPLMSAVWGILDRYIPGPFGMLLLHNAIFWAGAAVFWRHTWRKSILLGLGLIGFAFLPPVLALLSTIWKDVGLGAAFLLASALLYGASKTHSRASLFASSIFLFYGYAVRLNAAPAVIPLALWSGFIACRMFPSLKRRTESLKLLPVICGIGYFLVLALAVNLTTSFLIRKTGTSYPYQQVLLHDLAAISKTNGEIQFPAYIVKNENFSLEKVQQRYNSHSVNGLIYGEKPVFKLTNNPDEISELREQWLHVVLNNKRAYLKARFELFMHLLSFNEYYVAVPYLMEADFHNPPEFKSPHGTLNKLVTAYYTYFYRSLFFRGFFWVLISLGLVYLSARGKLHGDMEIIFVLSSSGLLYAVAYFFLSPSTEFRYLWWTVLANFVSLLFLLSYAFHHWGESRRAKQLGESVAA